MPTAYESEVLADAPLGFWMLNETGSTITDLSGNGRNGTNTGGDSIAAAPVRGSAKALQFVAANSDRAVIPDNAAWDTSTFTVEYWWRGTTAPGSGVVSRDSNPEGWGNRSFNIAHNATQHYARLFGAGATANTYTTPHPAGIDPLDGQWHHFVTALNAGGTMLCYLDGQAAASVNISSSTPNSCSVPIIMMAVANDTGSYNTFTNHRDGDLAAVAFFGSKLSAARVQAHFAAGDADRRWLGSNSSMVMG